MPTTKVVDDDVALLQSNQSMLIREKLVVVAESYSG